MFSYSIAWTLAQVGCAIEVHDDQPSLARCFLNLWDCFVAVLRVVMASQESSRNNTRDRLCLMSPCIVAALMKSC